MKKPHYFHQGTRSWFKSSSPSGTKTGWDKQLSSNEIEKLEEIFSNISEPNEEEFIKNKLMREKSREEKSIREKLIREKLIQDTVDKINQKNGNNKPTNPTLFDGL